jgi:ABC-type bacteriocin/lantibiotic exporter with double-glycine peptidase domain
MNLITEFNKFKDLTVLKDFPNIRQTFHYDCGPSVIQMIALYSGIEIEKGDLIKKVDFDHNIEKDGIAPKEIVKAFKEYKIKSELSQYLTIDELKKFINKGYPVVIMLQAYSQKENPNYKKDKTDGHYAVCIGYNKENLIFADSSSFNHTYLTNDEFMKRWHDVDKFDNKFNNCGIVVKCEKRKFEPDKIVHMA